MSALMQSGEWAGAGISFIRPVRNPAHRRRGVLSQTSSFFSDVVIQVASQELEKVGEIKP
jgi:hypothetical protein